MTSPTLWSPTTTRSGRRSLCRPSQFERGMRICRDSSPCAVAPISFCPVCAPSTTFRGLDGRSHGRMAPAGELLLAGRLVMLEAVHLQSELRQLPVHSLARATDVAERAMLGHA